jgi:hypothetical protein
MAKAKSKTPRATKARRAATKKSPAQLKALAEGAVLKRVGDKEFDLSDYQAVKSAGGNSSLDCGDGVAKQLRGMDLEDVYKEYARVFGKDDAAAMRKRYAELNVGMQRMNLGNRIRAAANAKAA